MLSTSTNDKVKIVIHVSVKLDNIVQTLKYNKKYIPTVIGLVL